ncbi:MAG: exodeoxyribonuclease VII large subunit [Firmicutes bacterium]|nr:exodeoxyribonuclease VII large subunit [Bacillota bacterium]
MPLKPVSVSQLNSYIKRVLASDPILSNVTVKGEISKLTRHSSGHWYFTLKDEYSKISCFLGADRVAQLRYDIDEGMEISATGSISVYERGGYYSFNIRSIELEGEGALKAAFEKLKARLEAEGLFDQAHKKPLPEFPRRIGVVTSPTGAAIRDIITTVKRRSPLVDILIYPALVQGEGAAATIAEGIKALNRLSIDLASEGKKPLDLIIAGRGGGSAEDLWAFNEEIVARAIYESELPVISAVGHEVDFLISDYAADLRAATPTAAAELAVPHIDGIRDILRNSSPERLFRYLEADLEMAEFNTSQYMQQAKRAFEDALADREHILARLKNDIDAANPLAALEQGFALVRREDGSRAVSASEIDKGDILTILFRDGSLKAEVQERTVK